MPTPNNPPAFPNDCHPSNDPDGKLGYRGMTLRDYFAAKAMQGDWANPSDGAYSNVSNGADMEKRVRLYYMMADAMLKEREK